MRSADRPVLPCYRSDLRPAGQTALRPSVRSVLRLEEAARIVPALAQETGAQAVSAGLAPEPGSSRQAAAAEAQVAAGTA